MGKNGPRLAAVSILTTLLAVCARESAAQTLPIGVIDFYGLHQVAGAQVRAALAQKEGDTLAFDDTATAVLAAAEQRIGTIPGVVRAHVNMVCCADGRLLLFVGLEEAGAHAMRLREAPVGTERVAPDVIASYRALGNALAVVTARGDVGEDRSAGHALSYAPELRVEEERFIVFAARDMANLRAVVRDAADPEHRMAAAEVLGYAADKAAVIDDLVFATTDPDQTVRNNALRALLVIASMTPSATQLRPRIPYESIVAFLNSPIWTDRNKSLGVLVQLTAAGNPTLLAQLRQDATTSLVEMARWRSDYGQPALLLLGRLAGMSDEQVMNAWATDREIVIKAALAGIR